MRDKRPPKDVCGEATMYGASILYFNCFKWRPALACNVVTAYEGLDMSVFLERAAANDKLVALETPS